MTEVTRAARAATKKILKSLGDSSLSDHYPEAYVVLVTFRSDIEADIEAAIKPILKSR